VHQGSGRVMILAVHVVGNRAAQRRELVPGVTGRNQPCGSATR
jgi:hypothetical protein